MRNLRQPGPEEKQAASVVHLKQRASVIKKAFQSLLFALGDDLIARLADVPDFGFGKHFAVFETSIRNILLYPNKEQ